MSAKAKWDAINEGIKQARLARQRNHASERADLSADEWHDYEKERVDISHVVHLPSAILNALPSECGVFEYPEDTGDFERCPFPRRIRYMP